MTASDFYKKMAISLAKNVANETTPLVKIYVATTASGTDTFTEVTSSTKEADLTGTYTKIVVEESEQPWVLGMMPQAFIPFAVQFIPVTVDGLDRIWGVSTPATPVNFVQDGHVIADLEYFCMGARGDIYRGMGYPNIIRTTYLVDPTKKYDTLDIHYYYTGDNESVQKSEKTITLVAVDDGSHTLMKSIVAAVNTASGLSIADPA